MSNQLPWFGYSSTTTVMYNPDQMSALVFHLGYLGGWGWRCPSRSFCSLHLSNACVFLQLGEARFIPADEIFERGVVRHTELSPGELHASLQLLYVTQDILQTHCPHREAKVSATELCICAGL